MGAKLVWRPQAILFACERHTDEAPSHSVVLTVSFLYQVYDLEPKPIFLHFQSSLFILSKYAALGSYLAWIFWQG